MPHFEAAPHPPDSRKEQVAEVAEHVIRDEFFDAVEMTLKKEINERVPKIPDNERSFEKITSSNGKEIGLIEKIRRPKKGNMGEEDIWLIVDFDDVINYTTSFNEQVQRQLHEQTGISLSDLRSLYDEAKTPNEEGKRVFRFTKFIEAIKEGAPDPQAVNQVLQGIDYGAFVDQAVKRALIASRCQDEAVRVSILTYGDPEYQKQRIHSTDLDEVVDDVIYTESSKRDVVGALLEGYRRNDYPYSGEIAAPFVITIDDSPEHIDDYAELPLERRYVNMRFHHPQAKRYEKTHQAPEVVVDEESAKNQAAINIYKASRIASSQYAQEDRARVFQILRSPEEYDDILSQWGGYRRDTNVKISKKGGHIIREFDQYLYKDSWSPVSHLVHDYGKVASDGSFENELLSDVHVDFEEFIREARNT